MVGRKHDLRSFQGPDADHLTDAGLDVPQLAEDDFSWDYPVGHPLALGFKSLEHDVEPVPQSRENVIMIVGVPVTCIQGRGRPSHENRVGNYLLQARSGLQDGEQFRAGAGNRVCLWRIVVRKLLRHGSIISDVIMS
jgi:hypothetical protein